MSEKNIHKDDLDDIIEIASRLQQKEEASTQISLEEVEDVAKELGIPPEKVKESLSFLENQLLPLLYRLHLGSVLAKRQEVIGIL